MIYRGKEMKVVLVCFMLLFICSCHDNFDNSTANEPKKTNRSEEILKIMRADSIHQIETGNFYWMSAEEKEKLLSEARKMKEDYYYNIDPNVRLTIAGPDWEIKGPIPLDNAPTFENFREKCEEGDELYFYRSDANSWGSLMGSEGYVLIRDNKVVAKIVTVLN
jgi:hypothetical protein